MADQKTWRELALEHWTAMSADEQSLYRQITMWLGVHDNATRLQVETQLLLDIRARQDGAGIYVDDGMLG